LFLYLIYDLLFLSVERFDASSEYSLFSRRFEESIPGLESFNSYSFDRLPAYSFYEMCF